MLSRVVLRAPPWRTMRLAPRPPPWRHEFRLRVCERFVLGFLLDKVRLDICCLRPRRKSPLRPWSGTALSTHRRCGDPANPDLAWVNPFGSGGHRGQAVALRARSCKRRGGPGWDQSERLLGPRHIPVFARIVIFSLERARWLGRGRSSWRQVWNWGQLSDCEGHPVVGCYRRGLSCSIDVYVR